jgi:hypothetical protein
MVHDEKNGDRASKGAYQAAAQPKMPPDAVCAPITGGAAEMPCLPDFQGCAPVCECPKELQPPANCFESLINAQTKAIAQAELATKFKEELEGLLQKAKDAEQAYTVEIYDELLIRWQRQDAAIAKLIKTAVCNSPNWLCQLECEVCPLYEAIRKQEQRLGGTGTPATSADSLHEQLAWLRADRDRKEAYLNRIKDVLAVWETPHKHIEEVLGKNQELIDALDKLAPESGKHLYDLFIVLIPRHLAIAPPASNPATTTLIAVEYTRICNCGPATKEDCCGPDLGSQTPRMRQLGPHAYLIPPRKYLPLICCLVVARYMPASTAFATIQGDVSGKEDEIKRTGDSILARWETFERDALAALAKPYDWTKVQKCAVDGEKPAPEKDPGCGGCS